MELDIRVVVRLHFLMVRLEPGKHGGKIPVHSFWSGMLLEVTYWLEHFCRVLSNAITEAMKG
jgi:hypothetical protein